MKIPRTLTALVLCPVLLAPAALGCGRSPANDAPAIPASADPEGKDLVEGAIVAAQEAVGGYRLYKIVHVDDYPDPIGAEYHMIAYDPKAVSLQEAAKIWRLGTARIALDHMLVRMVSFIKRDHRVLAVEKVTAAEAAPYLRSRPTSPGAKPPGSAL